MISCIAVDDEPMALDLLKEYIQKYEFLELGGAFRDALAAMNYLQSNAVDLIFLDINMPDLTGIQFIKAMPQPRPAVIFCTAYTEYAIESYEYEVVDYLLKPIEFDRFLQAVMKANKQIQFKKSLNTNLSTNKSENETSNKDFIFVKSGTDMLKIMLNDVTHIEAAGNYVAFHASEKKILSLQSMGDVMKLLPQEQFLRVHKSFIVSFNFIQKIETHQVHVNGFQIPIGKAYRNEFKKWIDSRS